MPFKKTFRDPGEPEIMGEGITRCSEPSSRLYWVEVLIRGQAPLYSYVRAINPGQAVQFCHARHPNALMARVMEEQ